MTSETSPPSGDAPRGGKFCGLGTFPAEGRTAVRIALAAAAGGAQAFSFAPFDLPLLQIAALATIFGLALRARSALGAALLGGAFGLGWFGVGISWIYISLHEYGGLWPWLAAAATAALAAYLALYPALALAAAVRISRSGTWARGVALAAAWTLADWLRGIVLTGFPWLATGYAQTDGPLAGFAPLLGVYGVGAGAALLAVLAAWALDNRCAPRRWVPALLGMAVLLAGGATLHTIVWSHPYGAPLRVRLVQGDVSQDIKFADTGLGTALTRYLPELAVNAKDPQRPKLIVFPESAFPVPLQELPDEVVAALDDPVRRAGAALIFGIFLVEPENRYFNSALGVAADGAVAPQRYSKRHLVPFGEFIPYGFHWFVDMLHIPIGDQQHGNRYQEPMRLAGQNIAVNICFEDLFGSLIRDAWHDPDRQPTVLLNLSNLAWFDASIALPQDLQIARMRAIETARPLLHDTNTGVTAIIDARGGVQSRLPIQRQGTLEGSVQGMTGETPFLRFGNVPILLASAFVLVISAARHRKT